MPNIIRNNSFEDPSSAADPVPEWEDIEHSEQVSITGPDGSASCVRITALTPQFCWSVGRECFQGQIKQKYHEPRKYAWSDFFFSVRRDEATTFPSFLRVEVVYQDPAGGEADFEIDTDVDLAADPVGTWVRKKVLIHRNGRIKRIKIEFNGAEEEQCYLDNMSLGAEDDIWVASLGPLRTLLDREVRRYIREMSMPRLPFERRMSMGPADDQSAWTSLMLQGMTEHFEERISAVQERLNAVHRLLLEQRYAEIRKQESGSPIPELLKNQRQSRA